MAKKGGIMNNCIELAMIEHKKVTIYVESLPTPIILTNDSDYELLENCICITKNNLETIIPKNRIIKIEIRTQNK